MRNNKFRREKDTLDFSYKSYVRSTPVWLEHVLRLDCKQAEMINVLYTRESRNVDFYLSGYACTPRCFFFNYYLCKILEFSYYIRHERRGLINWNTMNSDMFVRACFPLYSLSSCLPTCRLLHARSLPVALSPSFFSSRRSTAVKPGIARIVPSCVFGHSHTRYTCSNISDALNAYLNIGARIEEDEIQALRVAIGLLLETYIFLKPICRIDIIWNIVSEINRLCTGYFILIKYRSM